ncbi:MAG TPA: CHAP domain-containing protein [Candidatus Saccharimonadales bacterium]|nr:CHAP domain-containing protein [Candidatus Saccharimonadales bacterium]
MIEKYRKLSDDGFAHHLAIVAFAVVFAVIGVGYMVAGHAQNNKKQKRPAQAQTKSVRKPAQQKKKVPTLRPDPQPAILQPITDGSADSGTGTAASASGVNGVGPPPAAKPGLDAAIIAKSKLGSGYDPKYSYASNAWCAGFATWVWRNAGVNIPHYQNASSIAAWGKKNKRWHTSKPRVGDIMIYSSIHVGIVVSSDGKNIKAVDGNWSGRVSYHQSGSDNGGPIKADYRNFYTSGVRVSGFVSP